MRAAVLGDGQIRFVRQYSKPEPQDGEVLVRVQRAGICDTDLQLVRGYMGFRGVPGHEFVGVAESGTYHKKRVVGEINCACARCEMCQGGLGNHCPSRTVLGILKRDGAFADYVVLPERNLHLVPAEISLDEAVFIEPLAAAFQIPRQVPLDKRTRAVVLGDGKLGYLVAQVLKLHGCQVLVVGKYAEKLRIIERLGVGTEALGQLRRVRDYGLVVDCTGSPSGFPTALELVRPRGTIVLKTTVHGSSDLQLATLVIDEITVVGSRCGPFAVAIEALRTRKVEVTSIIEDIWALTDIVPALDAAARPGAGKMLIAIDESAPAMKRIKKVL
jgi:threonine dehydrogenase-like Zn-dependent dehydrogenase